MERLTEIESDILSIMYEGDKNRDASSSIRGFLYQDYITIGCLLQEDVVYVCTEYLEDIDVINTNGDFEFIQVKYYPNTKPNVKEISTDLYYQYLRFKMLGMKKNLKPRLFIYRPENVEKPTCEEMLSNLDYEGDLPQNIEFLDYPDSIEWLRTNVYNTTKKEEQKRALFSEMASVESLNSFIGALEFSMQRPMKQYKEDLMESLSRLFPMTGTIGYSKEHWGQILFGLAISYIQRRYESSPTIFEQVRFKKDCFVEYLETAIKKCDDQAIGNYLVTVTTDLYEEINNNAHLSAIQGFILNLIYRNTVGWIKEIVEPLNGQYRLLNTLSVEENVKISDYYGLSEYDRFLCIVECNSQYKDFLCYMWKIILDICMEGVVDYESIKPEMECFMPKSYINNSVEEYICFNFPQDKEISTSVILPTGHARFDVFRKNIVGRLVKARTKPKKWFFANSKMKRGKNYYDYSTANIIDNPTVADLGDSCFYIECMKCIDIDGEGWEKNESCEECIFKLQCVKEEQ